MSVSPDSLVITGTSKRPPGRPRVVKDGVRVTTYLPSESYDQLLKLANARGESMTGLIRTLLTLKIR